MSARKCWTCNSEHDPDEACKPAPTPARSGPLIREEDRPRFNAKYDGYCSAGDIIREGDYIRADGEGGWIHVFCEEFGE